MLGNFKIVLPLLNGGTANFKQILDSRDILPSNCRITVATIHLDTNFSILLIHD